ncbi:MAG TPA: hypothetical protein VF660_00200 [Actinomycetota bacterium]
MKMRSAAALAASVAAVLVVWTSWSGSGQATSSSERVEVIRTATFAPSWTAEARGDVSDSPILVSVTVDSPSSLAQMDVIATATLDYKTSRGDQGAVRVEMVEGANKRGPALRPGPYRVVSPSSKIRTSTALQWGNRAVAAAGESYTFLLTVEAVDRNGDGTAFVNGKKVTLTIEMRPVGP